MGPPPAAGVTRYFSDFHATAVHTWATGFPDEIPGWGGSPYVTWLQSDGTSAANGLLLGGISPPPGRIGYQIGDEPPDTMTVQVMANGAAAVRAADPGALLILNFAPDISGYAAIFAAATPLTGFDVFSMDAYTYGKGAYKNLKRVRDAALAGNKVWWRYANAYWDTGHSAAVTEADIRWDANVGAAYGYTGLTWFIYQVADGSTLKPLLFADAGDFEAAPTAQYAWVQAVNLEMANLERSLVMLHSADVRYVASSIVSPPETTAWSRGAGGDPYLASVSVQTLHPDAVLGHFTDDCGDHYTLVLNAGHEDGDFPNQSGGNQDVTLGFDFSGATDPTLDRTVVQALDPSTGAVTDRPLSSSGTLTLTLRGGGAVLLKYKTAHPFAMQ